MPVGRVSHRSNSDLACLCTNLNSDQRLISQIIRGMNSGSGTKIRTGFWLEKLVKRKEAIQLGLQTDRIWTDNIFIIYISVIIFRIRIVSDTDTDRIFNGYRTDTYTNTNIFRILSKNIIYIIKK
jgi:hypothetical protein